MASNLTVHQAIEAMRETFDDNVWCQHKVNDPMWGMGMCADCSSSWRIAAAALVAAARAEAIEEAAKIPDLWANSNTCDPPRTCDHQRQGGEIAERIRALARKGVEP